MTRKKKTTRVELIELDTEEEVDEEFEDGEANDEQLDDGTFEEEFDLLTERMLEIVHQGQEVIKENDSWRKPQWKDFAVLLPSRTGLIKLEKFFKGKKISPL